QRLPKDAKSRLSLGKTKWLYAEANLSRVVAGNCAKENEPCGSGAHCCAGGLCLFRRDDVAGTSRLDSIVPPARWASKTFHRGFGRFALHQERPTSPTDPPSCFCSIVRVATAQRSAGKIRPLSNDSSHRQTARIDHVAPGGWPGFVCRFRR